MDVKKVAALGGLAAALVTGSYFLFSQNEIPKRKKRRGLCPGLENYGTNCFLNAILQGLAPCRSMVQWLGDFLDRHAQSTANDRLAAAVLKILKGIVRENRMPNVLNNDEFDNDETHSSVHILDALRSKYWIIPPGEQDAHELFSILTQTLEEEAAHFPGILSLFDISSLQNPINRYQSVDGAISKSRGLLPLLPLRKSAHPFQGLLASQLECKLCRYKYPIKYEHFDSLSLNIPPNFWAPLSLHRLLQEFVTPESIHSVECHGCAKRMNKGTAVPSNALPKPSFHKKLTIGKLPQCLCLHVPRTQWLDNGTQIKRSDHIPFPEYLQMDDYVYRKGALRNQENRNTLVGGQEVSSNGASIQARGLPVPGAPSINLLRALNYQARVTFNGIYIQQPSQPFLNTYHTDVNQNSPLPSKYQHTEYTYRLESVVCHIGDVISGHFVTYRRCPPNPGETYSDSWLYTSDRHVKVSSLSDVLLAQAYMLFYERV